MNFAALKQELSDRGFAHLSDARLGNYINAARAELDRSYNWPWREASVTGAAPLAVADLGTIEAVVNTSQSSAPLAKVDYRGLLDTYGDLSQSGTPSFYYVAWPSGVPELATFPTNSDVLGIQYWKVTPDLVNASDTPVSPTQAHYVIVDMAVRQAYLDAGDFFSSSIAQGEADRKIAQLLDAYTPGVSDGPDAYVGTTGASGDW